MNATQTAVDIIGHLQKFAKTFSPDAQFNFSTYKITDYEEENVERKYFSWPAEDIARGGFLSRKITELLTGTNREMSVLSTITHPAWPNSVKHIPMIDFCSTERFDFVSTIIKGKIGKSVGQLTFFNTKHSFHAYGDIPLTKKEYKHWLLQMLWQDETDSFYKGTFDRKWILFTLMRGFGSLRISYNSRRYSDYGPITIAGSVES